MKNLRPMGFILTSSNHGSFLVNRFDYHQVGNNLNEGYGVGFQILNTSAYDQPEVDLAVQLLVSRRENYGDGVVAIDCGANIGIHTIEWAKAMYGWGEVIAFEAQERIFYALAGNITINNCFNAKAIFAAVGSQNGKILVPAPNYLIPASFGSLELRKKINTEFIGQEISYVDKDCQEIQLITIDSMGLKRLDFLKIDIEGMEMEALLGAKESIAEFKPILLIEKVKSNESELRNFLENYDYKIVAIGMNLLAINSQDPISSAMNVK
jgi:FkbM family methyltransferase